MSTFIAAQSDSSLRDRLTAAFTALTSTNGVQLSFGRVNRNRFKSNLRVFVGDIRGFMGSS